MRGDAELATVSDEPQFLWNLICAGCWLKREIVAAQPGPFKNSCDIEFHVWGTCEVCGGNLLWDWRRSVRHTLWHEWQEWRDERGLPEPIEAKVDFGFVGLEWNDTTR